MLKGGWTVGPEKEEKKKKGKGLSVVTIFVLLCVMVFVAVYFWGSIQGLFGRVSENEDIPMTIVAE